MAKVERITSAGGARALAERLLSKGRKLPLVLITAGNGTADGLISAHAVADDVGELAEVCWMPTGDATWAFTDAMPPLTQVFGDAARVYAIDEEWKTNPWASRLHMCGTRDKALQIEDELVGEAMQAAARAGLLAQRVKLARTVTGEVKGFPSAGRALVRGAFGLAAIRAELVAVDVEINSLLTIGMSVIGKLDEQERLIDVAPMLLSADAALSAYEIGDVVPARVRTVGRTVVALELHPKKVVEIGVPQVTGNASDDLRDLMSVGEIVPVRVERVDNWILSMLDVEDVAMTPACSLLPHGPSWIQVVEAEPLLEDEPPAEREVHDLVAVPVVPAVPTFEKPPAVAPRPPAPGPHAHELLTAREALVRERSTTESLRAELAQLSRSFDEAEAEVAKARREIEHLRTERRRLIAKAGKARRTADPARPADYFNDPEQALRHEVYLAWVQRIPAGEKTIRRMPSEWLIGDHFIESLMAMPPEVRDKVPDVIFEVLVGIADRSDGRELHRLRTGTGGDDPVIQRAGGETCWRVAVQRGTPSAARLHFWRGPGTPIELSRVVRHDDMRP